MLLETSYSYDTMQRLTGVNANASGNSYAYGYDLNERNQRTKHTLANGEYWQYQYNNTGEVTGALKYNSAGELLDNQSYSYAFDGIGNRISAAEGELNTSYAANLLNQYTAVNAAIPTYDADGNMLTNGAWTYTYNGENRLIRAEKEDYKEEYSYDYMGRRYEKKTYTKGLLSLYTWALDKHEKFVYDGYKLAEVRNGDDELQLQITWQPASAGADIPLSMSYAGAHYYYVTDGNKNVTGLLDASGNRVAAYSYGPFGQVLSANGAMAEVNPLRFSSEYSDTGTGLIYYNYRHYSPELGRWLRRDPIEEQGGVNMYGMLGNDPVNSIDVLGLQHFSKRSWKNQRVMPLDKQKISICMLKKLLGKSQAISSLDSVVYYEGHSLEEGVLGEANTASDTVIIDYNQDEKHYLGTMYHEYTHVNLPLDRNLWVNILETVTSEFSSIPITRRNEQKINSLYDEAFAEIVYVLLCCKDETPRYISIRRIDIIRNECGGDLPSCESQGYLPI